MIDGFKCSILGVQPESLRQRLEFSTLVNDNTAELAQYSYSRLDNLWLTLTPNHTCLVRGSLHKYAHGGMNNSDFGYSDLKKTVGSLVDFFEVLPENFVLQNLEFGVNLEYPPSEIIDNLLLYGSNPFVQMSANVRQSKGVKCQMSQYSLKVYGKTKTRLRIETQVKKMQYIQKITNGQPLTFVHLLDKSTLRSFEETLLCTWGKVLLWEDVQLEEMKLRERELFALAKYPGFWTDLQKAKPENFRKTRKRFLELQERYQITNRKENLTRLTSDKWKELMDA